MSFKLFCPVLAGAQFQDRLVGCLGAIACIALTKLACSVVPFTAADLPGLIAPMGASAVLVFAVPASPLAQPWPVIGGNTVSALVGVATALMISNVAIAAGVAVGAAILAMSMLRCLHPPGGAAALTAVIGGKAVHAAGFSFALAPVAIDSVVLVALAMLFHRLAGRHSYPHRPALPKQALAEQRAAAGFHARDIDAALADMHESFDISRDDLDLLLSRAEVHAGRRLATP